MASLGLAVDMRQGGVFGDSRYGSLLAAFCLILALWHAPSALAESQREENGDIARKLDLPIYQWSNTKIPPRGVVVTVHGLIMHAGSFEALATHLADQGFTVVSIDLRGYGRWYHQRCQKRVDYKQSEADLTELAKLLKQRYSDVPIFYLGESLGADLSIRLASHHPKLVSGLILSSPAIKGRWFLLPEMFKDAALLTTNLTRKLNLVPYIKHCSSEDPRIREEILADPLVRTQLNVKELFRSRQAINSTLHYVKGIPPDTPVLVIQGNADRTVKANAVVLLLQRLRSQDQTVRWFPGRGHILLETSFLQPQMVETIDGWLDQHVLTGYQVSKEPANLPLGP